MLYGDLVPLRSISISSLEDAGMIGRGSAIIIALAVGFPVFAHAQTVMPNAGGPTGFMAYGPFGGSNPAPGGLTLVPGTVAVPGVSGAANTGTIPLPGTTGAPSVPNMTGPIDSGGQYPRAFYPLVPTPGVSQNTLPQSGQITDPTITAPTAIPGRVQGCFYYVAPLSNCR